MYIKLTFQAYSGKIGAESVFAMSELAEYPQLVNLPDLKSMSEKVAQGAYIQERGVLYDQNINRLAYYLDCNQLSAEQIQLALELFSKHYRLERGVMPQVLIISDDPGQNELIRNMQTAIHNAGLMLQMRDFEVQNAVLREEPFSCAIL